MEWWKLVVIAAQILRALADNSHGLQELPEVQCGEENMQIIVPQHLKQNSTMKVLNKDGKMEPLRNDPSCGIWVTKKYDGSAIVGISYDGCYVSQTDTHFVFTLGLTKKQNGGKKVTVRKEMTCAVGIYHDSPIPSQCDSILMPDRLSCISSQDSCATMGCCYDPADSITPCYYGNQVTARCTSDGLFSIALPNTLTVPPLNLTSVRLLQNGGPECNPTASNGYFLLYQFPISACGTTYKLVGDQAVYENQLVASKTLMTWNSIAITRDSTFRLLVRCSFAVSGLLPLKVDVVTLPPPPPVSSIGPINFELRISLDSSYINYYTDSDYPVVKILRDPVYVEVRILQRSDPNLVLVLHQCWSTPSPDPLSSIQWPILIDGCPFIGDNYMSDVIPVAPGSALPFPSYYSRFDVMTFTFVDQNTEMPLAGQVYIHCSASACVPSAIDNCATVCNRRKRSVYMLSNKSDVVLVSSDVPIYFDNSLPEMQNDREDIYGFRISQPGALINGAAIAMGFVAVVLLTLTTWALHRQRKSRSLLISKLPVTEKTVNIKTIFS
ncbi:zona pellucida sperm-binding protein 4-like [Bufo bufo]|uniref:zona pellucida sperm-binding protein 4-like n=1 Tax=Bufo bufo TaxID=8384 RepID=UPI001ABEBB88|nr:zona pellucida sperm-binding protein 4-like [Bufo bufo]